MTTIRCVIVGMGSITQSMLRFLGPKPWFEAVAVVDVRQDALDKAQSQLNLASDALFTDLDQALANVNADAVIINTPSELHFRLAKSAIAAGCHALVAKPITNGYEEAIELVALAEEKQVTLSVGQQMRYRRHYQAVARFIREGRLGTVELINFINTKPRHQALNLRGMSQPALFEMSCHHFDSLMSLVPGLVPEQISCDGFQPSWSVYDGPCMVNGLITFSQGLHVLYQGGFSSQADNYELRLEGSAGALRCRGIHMSNDTMTYEFAERGGKFEVITIDDNIPAGDPWGHFFDIWHEYMSGGAEPPFSGRNNLQVFALLSAGIDFVNSGEAKAVAISDNPRFASAFDTSYAH